MLITLFSIYGLIGTQVPLENEVLRTFFIFPQLDLWIWILIILGTLWLTTLEGAYRLLRLYRPMNWIDKHLLLYGKLPILPKKLVPLVDNYKQGERITKDITILTPSGQLWNGLIDSERKQWEELVIWKGENPQDYIDRMKQMLPKPRIRWM